MRKPHGRGSLWRCAEPAPSGVATKEARVSLYPLIAEAEDRPIRMLETGSTTPSSLAQLGGEVAQCPVLGEAIVAFFAAYPRAHARQLPGKEQREFRAMSDGKIGAGH